MNHFRRFSHAATTASVDEEDIGGDEIARIQQNNRLREKIKKQARTHSLLVSIVVVFALSWFPLNALNILLDIHHIFEVPNLLIQFT